METQQAERVLSFRETRDERAEGGRIFVRHRQAERHKDEDEHQNLDCRESNGCGRAQAIERRDEARSAKRGVDK